LNINKLIKEGGWRVLFTCQRVNISRIILEMRKTYSGYQKLSATVSSDVLGGGVVPGVMRVASTVVI
jgi:hypothetical protein